MNSFDGGLTCDNICGKLFTIKLGMFHAKEGGYYAAFRYWRDGNEDGKAALDREGIGSGAVVKLCAEEFGWKKSTTYTMLRRLCEHGLFQNVNSIVTSVMSEDDYKAKVGTELVNDKFDGSLPMFVAAFTKKNKLSAKDKKELLAIIEGSKK